MTNMRWSLSNRHPFYQKIRAGRHVEMDDFDEVASGIWLPTRAEHELSAVGTDAKLMSRLKLRFENENCRFPSPPQKTSIQAVLLPPPNPAETAADRPISPLPQPPENPPNPFSVPSVANLIRVISVIRDLRTKIADPHFPLEKPRQTRLFTPETQSC